MSWSKMRIQRAGCALGGIWGREGKRLLICALAPRTVDGNGSGDALAELGSIISVGGRLSPDVTAAKEKSSTPVLLPRGSLRFAGTSSALGRTMMGFQDVAYRQWKGKMGDGVPANHEEMTPLMEMWGRRMRSLKEVSVGSVQMEG